MGLKHGSLFSGIGGFDLAAEWMGWENIFHCEWNEFGQRVLKHYWPNADSLHDITKTDFTKYEESIDIISGGFPCQPYSAAGKRLGKEDERHLWPEMLRAIREIKPTWVVGENVRGLVNWNGGLVFDEVQADLEAEGYEVQPFLLPAAAVNAPHRRDRIWFIAYRNSKRFQKEGAEQQTTTIEQYRKLDESTTNSSCCGLEANNHLSKPSDKIDNSRQVSSWDVTDTDKIRLQLSQDTRKVREGQSQVCQARSEFADAIKADGEKWNASNSSNQGLQGSEVNRSTTNIGKKQNKQLARFIQPDWQIFPTKPPICGGDDGIPRELDSITFPKWRNESIKAYGNAIVPQVALQIFKAIEQYENIKRAKDNN